MDEELCKKKLLVERPSFHGRPSVVRNWQLADDVLQWLDVNIRRGQRTLETGCGYSTILFALKGAQHTVISPMIEEHERIRQWCEANEIDVSSLDFVLGRSEDVLPALGPAPLDLVLIDGWHAFPAPFLDWFFTAKRLAVNGYVIVDDTQLKAVRILRDFLEMERGRWELVARFERTDIFQKVSHNVFVGEWYTQPYCAKDRLRIFMRMKFVAIVKLFPPLYHASKAVRNRMLRNNRELK
jgi:Methyltransferase domain